jgi:hypothetical protein
MTLEITQPSQTRLPAAAWRDLHTVPESDLADVIVRLEAACREQPRSVELRTCLGVAYAMHYEVYKSMDALELAVELDPSDFLAQFKFAELHYRLRALVRAERETVKAAELASNGWELQVARKQLQEIRRLMREGTQRPEWTKPLTKPALWLLALSVMLSVMVYWK